MQHYAAFQFGLHCLVKVKKIFRQNSTIFFSYNLTVTPLDMYNGLSQVYCITLEERIH